MSPFDGIRPPKKKKKSTIFNQKKTTAKQYKTTEEDKYRLVWMAAAIITLMIAIGWGWLFVNGKLSHSSGDNSKWETFTDSVGDLWNIFKTDVLKLEQVLNQTESTDTDKPEEKIKDLEKRVFPQFEDPQKQ